MKNSWKNNNILHEKRSLSFSRLREGAGAGYDITFYDIKLKNVEIVSKEVEEYESYSGDDYYEYKVKFKADVVPGNYDYSCEGYDWRLDTRNPINYYDEYLDNPYEYSLNVSGGVSEGTYTIDSIRKKDSLSDADIAEDIMHEKFDITTIFSGGYIHVPVGESIEFKENEYSSIDATASDIYNNAVLDYVRLDLPEDSVVTMNDCINYAMEPELWESDDEEDSDDEE